MSISVTYTAVLDVKRSTAEHLARLLRDHRTAARTRRGRRALGCFRQAVLVLRWFIDGTRLSQLSCDNGV
ncbi:IS5/IS1182 family transposase, partial [Streptomyces sp. NPDC056309]